MWNKSSKLNTGFGLIEIVVSSALIASSLFGLAFISQMALRASNKNINAVKAAYIAEESLEAVRTIRDDGWTANMSGFEIGETYYPSFASSVWSLSTTTPIFVDGVFERKIIFEEVWRRTSDDDITASTSPESKYLDDETLKVTSAVSWSEAGGETSAYELTTYLSNVFLD